MAQIRKIQSHFDAYSVGLAAITALTLMCSTPGVQASSDNPFSINGYQAGVRITIPLNGDKLKQDDATFAFTAGSTTRQNPETGDLAYLSFTADGYFRKAQLGTLNIAKPVSTVKITPASSNKRIKVASARRSYRRVPVAYRRAPALSRQDHCSSLETSARRISSRRQQLQDSYCYALHKHDKMISAYQRFKHMKRLNVAKLPSKNVMPELAGGPKPKPVLRTKRAKHAYFDYWVSRKAYQKALSNYRSLLAHKTKPRGRR